MPPLRMLAFLLLLFSSCDTKSTCPADHDLLTLHPTEVVEEYGNSLSVNCSTTTDDDYSWIRWRVGDEDFEKEEDLYFVSHDLTLTDWNMTAQCKIQLNDSVECSKHLKITVYKNPEVVSSIENMATVGEDTYYVLQCDVTNVAPIHNLIVRWYINDETTRTLRFPSETLTPVNDTEYFSVTVKKGETAVQVRCEAQLDFGPHGVQPPAVSQTHNLSAHYAPELNADNETGEILVVEGSNVTLNCDAEGNPPPAFHWTCEPVNLWESSNSLTLAAINVSTTCICTATNSLGHIKKTFSIQIEATKRSEPTSRSKPEARAPRACPLTVTPAKLVVQFGDPANATCSTSDSKAVAMRWKSEVNNTGFQDPPNLTWSVEKLKEWKLQPSCYILLNDGYQCSVNLSITLYKNPEVVSSIENMSTVGEDTHYDLQCDVTNVAPIQNLIVSWYINDETTRIFTFPSETLTPVNDTKYFSVTVKKGETAVQVRCEAQLYFGPHGVQPPAVSQTHNLSAHYAPELKADNETGEILVVEGSNVTLNCDAEGNPPPAFHWTCEPVNLWESSNSLTLAAINVSTTCICTATNSLGHIKKTFSIQIEATKRSEPTSRSKPEARTPRECPLTVTPAELVVQFGDPANATCSTSDSKAVAMGWKSEVNNTGFQDPPNLTWSVEKLKEWKLQPSCYIFLTDGYHCSVNLSITLYKGPDSIVVSGPDGPMVESKQYRLTCDITSVAPAERLRVSWYRGQARVDVQAINSTSETPINVTSTLNITAEREDNGSFFRCEVSFNPGPGESDSVLLSSSVPYLAVVLYKPLIKSCLSSFSGGEREFRMEMVPCESDGNPPPTVQWYYDDKPINSSQPLNRDDSGRYTVQLVNPIGTASTSVDITVEYRPSFTCEKNYTVVKTNIWATCTADGIPAPTVTWLKDGKEMTHWTNYDNGDYTLKASNTRGTAEHKLNLRILYAPELKEADELVEVVQGENVTLVCRAEGNPPPFIEWVFESSVSPKQTDRWRQSTVVVTGATSTRAGVYNCSATNDVGTATRTVTLVIKDKASGNPHVVIWGLLIALVILAIIMLLVLLYKRLKKHGQYSFVPGTADSGIPLKPAGGDL